MQYQATQKHIDGRIWRPDLPLQLVTLLMALAVTGLVFAGEYQFQLMANAYWVHHYLFGLGFTLYVFSAFGSRVVASVFTLTWSLRNELVYDHYERLADNPAIEYFVQWDHLLADLGGWLLALVILTHLMNLRR